MREFEASFEEGVESFLQVYPQYIDQVRPESNGLFREEDYPAADKPRKKFGVKLEILPIPTGNDFHEPESRFHATMVTLVFDLVELLPRLNVNGDANLNRFADQIRQQLCGFTAQDLKKHDLLRVATVNDAAEIVTEIDSVLREREASEP
jgi:hypothetical protein